MFNYLEKFLPSLATLSEPLLQLTHHETTWVWDSAQQQALVNVKSAVCITPVLQYYDLWQLVELQVDASQSGLGATLLYIGQPYDITVKYKKGKELYSADTLSRAPVQEDLNRVHDSDKEFIMQLNNISMHQHLNVTHMALDSIQQNRAYWHCRDELSVYDGPIFRGEHLVVPQEMRAEMLQKEHTSHKGLEASLHKVREIFYWPCMKNDVERKVSSCTICQEFSAGQPHMEMQTHKVYNKQYLILTDYYLDYWEIGALPSTDSAAIIKVMKGQFARHGIPTMLITDNATCFTSTEFQAFSRTWDFQHSTSTPYYPWGNGKAKASVKIAKNIMKKYLQTKVPEVVPELLGEEKQEYKKHYDRKARDLSELMIGQEVYINPAPQAASKLWSPGTITQQLMSCSYDATTKEGTRVRQNREALRSANSRVNTLIEDQGLQFENAVQNIHWRQVTEEDDGQDFQGFPEDQPGDHTA
ncbi:hypothetical protein PR048_012307 [Dryococelus australis]|uniref:RNA-directed DNA polymerase n=1 Tax=Dryococelus australis TaxID=614101 RepID=A0ABQ9HP13_9NEOP|nr:hypothetical protein PR048_012307 [Dryococelus australis]